VSTFVEPLANLEDFLRIAGRRDLVDRVRNLLFELDSLEFDAPSYLAQNLDIRNNIAIGGFETAFQHFYLRGEAEGRRGSGLSPYRYRNRMKASLQRRRPRIAFYGPVSARSGLGVAAQGYAKAFQSSEWDLDVIDSTDAIYLDRRSSTHIPLSRDADIVVIHINPEALKNFFQLVDRSILDGAYVIAIWVWELAAFKAEWIDEFSAVDEIWCPSTFTANAVRSMAPARLPVHVVHHVVENCDPVVGYDRAYFGIPSNAFVFLYVFDASSVIERKNPLAAVQAFRRAFKGSGDTALVLKCHSADADKSIGESFNRQAFGPNIILLDGFFDAVESRMLKRAVDAFVSPHRSEGFGINVAEAMLSGLPVIATDYSGSTEFLSSKNAFLIDYDLTTVTRQGGPYPTGAVWAEPDIGHLTDLMRIVHAGGPAVAQKAAAGQEFIRKHLSLQAIQDTVTTRIKAIVSESDHQAFDFDHEALRLRYLCRHPSSLSPTDNSNSSIPPRGEALVSIVVSVCDGEGIDLLRLFNSLLKQTFLDWELCVETKCSDQESADAVVAGVQGRDQRVRIISSIEHPGLPVRPCSPIEIATGSVLTYCALRTAFEADTLERFALALSEWSIGERHWSGYARYDIHNNTFSEITVKPSVSINNFNERYIFFTAKSLLLRSMRREPQLALGWHAETAYSLI
jgi:glycosyltransferase involved in cell wall biosynthesis